MAGQNIAGFTNVGILQDAENVNNLLPWIDSQEDLINFIRCVPLDHYNLRCHLALLHFIKDKDARESADFEQKVEDDAREILLCLPDEQYREIKERLGALGSLTNRKEVVIRQILQKRNDLAGLVDQLDQHKRRKSDIMDITGSDTNIKIRIKKTDGSLQVVSSIKQDCKSPKQRKVKHSKFVKDSSSSSTSSIGTSSSTDSDDCLNDLLGVEFKTEDSSGTGKHFNLVDYLEDITKARRSRIADLCRSLGVPIYKKPDDQWVLNDLICRLMAPEVIEIVDSPIANARKEKGGTIKHRDKTDQKISWKMKRSAFDNDIAINTMSKKRNYIHPARLSEHKNEYTNPKKMCNQPELEFKNMHKPMIESTIVTDEPPPAHSRNIPLTIPTSSIATDGKVPESYDLVDPNNDLTIRKTQMAHEPSTSSSLSESTHIKEGQSEAAKERLFEYWPEPDDARNQSEIKDEWSPDYWNVLNLPSTSKMTNETLTMENKEQSAINYKRNPDDFINFFNPPSTSKDSNVQPIENGKQTVNKDKRNPDYWNPYELPSTSEAANEPIQIGGLPAIKDQSVKRLEDVDVPSTSKPGGLSSFVSSEELLGSNDSWDLDPWAITPAEQVVIEETEDSMDEGEVIDEQKNVDNRLVSRLMEMFPQACPKYIRKICNNKLWDDFNDLVTLILSAEDYPKRPPKAPSPPKEVDPEQQLELIKEFLPDADPNYLRMKCQEYGKDIEGLNDFVNNARETKDYPTLKEYLRKKQLSAQSKQYTTEFNVENFVQLFPNPEKTFEDPKRVIVPNGYDKMYITIFFENRYDKLAKRTIKSVLDANGYKILASDRLLKKNKTVMKSKRKKNIMPDPGENILILQELAYLIHEDDIEQFLKSKLEKEKLEFDYAKECGLLNVCQCCFDDAILEKNTIVCPNGCKVCKECVIKSCEVNFGEGKLEFNCLNGCDQSYSLHTLQDVLPPKMFSKIAQKKALAEVKAAGIEELETCPFCDFATIPNENDKIFRCLNPDCMKESCRQCKEPNHVPLRCDEVEQDAEVKNRVFIENRMTEALLRKCWKCGTSFFKEEGCNKMTCTCGAKMCYICKQPVQDYKHFNGIGGDRYDLCPLYSDTNEINKANVLEAAKAAKTEVGPATLKVDPTTDVAKHYEERKRKLPREPHLDQLNHLMPPFVQNMHRIMQVEGPAYQAVIGPAQALDRRRADHRRLYLLLNRQIQGQLNPHRHQRPRP